MKKKVKIFTGYQIFVITILAFLQFTVILDFMVISPLGAQLLQELNITTAQFGYVVSAYAFSAGISGLLTAGFADRFDRKKLLMVFYYGFIIGTFLCSIAPDYHLLLIARIITGIFGGVLNSIIFAIITDLFQVEVRGRVMGFVQMAFSSSQVFGIPLGLYLSNHYGWHSPFTLIVAVGVIAGLGIRIYLKPIRDHLKSEYEHSAFTHLRKTISQLPYLQAFGTTTLIATGGFMLMPFASAFTVHNMGISMHQLPFVYMVTGIVSMVSGPIIGRYSDVIGKYKIFILGTLLSIVMVIILSHMGITSLWLVILINVLLFTGITSRIISGSALMTAVPDIKDRGAFMGVNASVQQISGGIASAIAGLIVIQTVGGKLEKYDTLGYVVAVTMLVTLGMMYFVNKYVTLKLAVKKI
ncbi:MAG: MFS transporter [Spirochaetia bacterium]|nr:MFS transporter [Spirochaetia bacterium]